MTHPIFERCIKLAAPALLASLATACQTTTSDQAVQTIAAADAPFERYRTFAFGFSGPPPAGSQLSPGSLDVENRLRRIVATVLARKGYVERSGDADFIIRLAAGTAMVPDVSLERCSVDDYDCTGQTLQRLLVAIDMYDVGTGAHAWHGATNVALANPRFDDMLLDGIVTTAFASLPRHVQTTPAPL